MQIEIDIQEILLALRNAENQAYNRALTDVRNMFQGYANKRDSDEQSLSFQLAEELVRNMKK